MRQTSRWLLATLALGIACGWTSDAARAELQTPPTPAELQTPPAPTEPETPPEPALETSIDDLALFGEAVAWLPDYRDNIYVYEQREEDLHEFAETFRDVRLLIPVRVQKVTRNEVFVEVPKAGKTRIVFQHDALPLYGNLRTVSYCGPPSTARAYLFSPPLGIRIGSELPLDVARALRKGDTLVIDGALLETRVRTTSLFNMETVSIVVDWKAVEVIRPIAPMR